MAETTQVRILVTAEMLCVSDMADASGFLSAFNTFPGGLSQYYIINFKKQKHAQDAYVYVEFQYMGQHLATFSNKSGLCDKNCQVLSGY